MTDVKLALRGLRGLTGPTGPAGTLESNTGFTAAGPSIVKGDSATLLQIQTADGTALLNVHTASTFVSLAGTRTSQAPRITGGTATDIGYDSFITSNCVARGTTLFRDEFQSTCDFQSLNGAHAGFDDFTQFGGAEDMNHARGGQSRMKINMTGGALLSEWTGFIALPIFNGTFNIGELQGFWFRDAQVDSGTQNVFVSYALRIDDCPNLGNNFKPIVSFSDKNSYLGGGLEFAATADVYNAREMRAGAVHATGGLATYNSSGGVAANYSGGVGFVRSYSDGAGTGDVLSLNPVGGRVIVGDVTGTNAGLALDVVGPMGASGGYFYGANQVVGAQGAAVADAAAATYVAPSGGATQDAEARTALAQLAVDVSSIRTSNNTHLARNRAHGLIAT